MKQKLIIAGSASALVLLSVAGYYVYSLATWEPDISPFISSVVEKMEDATTPLFAADIIITYTSPKIVRITTEDYASSVVCTEKELFQHIPPSQESESAILMFTQTDNIISPSPYDSELHRLAFIRLKLFLEERGYRILNDDIPNKALEPTAYTLRVPAVAHR